MIALIWKHNSDNTYVKSRQEESFDDFKKRIMNIYPYECGYHVEFISYQVIG